MSNNIKDQWRIIDIINWGTDYFVKKGIESPRLNIELILANVLEISRFDLYKLFDKPLIKEELKTIKEYIKRRLNREPLQYILGETYFLGRRFLIDNSSLIPRPETELLVSLALKDIKNKICKVMDIGTGCGCIAITIAINSPTSKIYAIDYSEKSLQLAKKNANLYNVENIIFEKLDILNELPSFKDFDYIISNPPYISYEDYKKLEPELFFEPIQALTDRLDGFSFYYRFAEIFPKLLNKDGKFFIEIAYNQHEKVKSIFEKNYHDIQITNDLNGIPRIIHNL